MRQDNKENLFEEKSRRYLYAAIIHEILKQKGESKENAPKPRWQRFLESTGGTALVTTVIGGILVAFITAIIQYGAKEREFQQIWLNRRGDQALIVYKDFLDKKQETIRNLYEQLGLAISVSENLIILTRQDLAHTAALKGEEQKRQIEYNRNIVYEYNSFNKEWSGKKENLGMLITYYHPNQSDVAEAWQNTAISIDTYMSCALDWFTVGERMDKTNQPCKNPERDKVITNIKILTKALENKRTYGWEGWDNPEALRKLLNDEEPVASTH